VTTADPNTGDYQLNVNLPSIEFSDNPSPNKYRRT
jgi:hypothetical protein